RGLDHHEHDQHQLQRDDGFGDARGPHERAEHEQHHRQPAHQPAGDAGQPVAQPVDDRQGKAEGDGLHHQRSGHHPAEALHWVLRGLFPLRDGVLAHAGSSPSRVRASPAVTTEPVISTPPPDSSCSTVAPSSTRLTAVSNAVGKSGSATTRSSPKSSLASLPSCPPGMARGDELRVTTTSCTTGSSASRMPRASLSRMIDTTSASLRNANSPSSASATAAAPAGLCAASSSTVGADRARSRRAGSCTAANASRTVSTSSERSLPAPRNAS